MRIAMIPLKAKHLELRQKIKQVKLLASELKRFGGVKIVDPESAVRVLGRRPRSAFDRLNKDKELIFELCERLQVDVLFFPEMELGTEHRPAKLISRMIGCRQGTQSTYSLSFSGRLNRALWRDIAQQADPRLISLMTEEQRPPPPPPPPPPPQFSRPVPPPSMISPGPSSMVGGGPPLGGGVAAEQALKPMTSPDARDPWAARLTLWAEGRAMNRTFDLTTNERSISLKGGISYTSRWIMGYGLSSRLVLSEYFAVEGEFSEFQFESTQVIYNLFDDNDFEKLKSLQRTAGLGTTISHTFNTGSMQHRAGVRVGWYMNQHQIEPNNEYKGFTAHGADLHAFGLFSLTEQSSWIELRGKIVPIVGLGDTVKEIGERAESLGFGFALNYVQRWNTGLGIKIGVSFDELVHSPTGVGRGGRIGADATDQLFQATVAAGWLGPK